PNLGELTVTEDLRVRVPVQMPDVTVPSDYEARVDYAISQTIPAIDSGLWRFAGRVSSDGEVHTPQVPVGDDEAGTRVWVRTRGEATLLRPSAWVGHDFIDVGGVPSVLTLAVQLNAGIPT